MHVVAFSTFVIKADDTFSVLNIDHPVFEPVGRWRHRRWNLPNNKLDNTSVCLDALMLG